MTTKIKQALLLLCILFIMPGYLFAQDDRAVITGIVTDETNPGVIGCHCASKKRVNRLQHRLYHERKR